MSTLVSNTFSSYQLTREEDISGRILNTQQKQVLQNQLSSIATDKLNLIFNPKEPEDYAMQVAYKQGQLDLINYLLAESEETEAIAYQQKAASTNQE
jgi:hypothetical protein